MDGFGLDLLGLLVLVGAVAGFVDSIAGGGGLLTVPVLMWCGLDPAQALATNKLQGTFGSCSATIRFIRSGEIDVRSMTTMIACTFVGAVGGAAAIQIISPDFLRDAIPVLLLGIAVWLLVTPRAGDMDAHQRITPTIFALTIGTGIGFYDGVFGPGTGTFFAIAFVSLLGFNLRKATAHTKVLNFTSNVASLLTFLLGGQIVWALGLSMGIGQYFGAQLGAHLVIRSGARLVRPMLVVASLAITFKMALSDDDNLVANLARPLIGWIMAALN